MEYLRVIKSFIDKKTTTFQSNIFILSCVPNAKKTDKVDDITFLKHFFIFPIVVREIK